jgi:hypothetical protein
MVAALNLPGCSPISATSFSQRCWRSWERLCNNVSSFIVHIQFVENKLECLSSLQWCNGLCVKGNWPWRKWHQSKDVPRATVQEKLEAKRNKIQPASWTNEIVFIGSRAKVWRSNSRQVKGKDYLGWCGLFTWGKKGDTLVNGLCDIRIEPSPLYTSGHVCMSSKLSRNESYPHILVAAWMRIQLSLCISHVTWVLASFMTESCHYLQKCN